ncbi:branched-chain amino acid ABC transporter permease [Thermobifida alba]|nr:branched-chain amino acid ABC transporter permease [Thermobifida alba]
MRSAMNHSSLLRRQAPTAALAAGVLAITLFIHADPASLDLSITVAVFSLLALSVAASYGQAGVLSVAQAAFAALGGYATAIATTRWDLPVLAGLAAAVAVPVLVAYPLARLVSRLSHLALAIATLVFGEIVVILLREGGDLTGSYIGISAIPSLPWAEDLFSYHLFAWAVVVAVTALYANLVRTSHGRSLQTIRYDVLRARADGVNVARRTAAVFSFSAGIAGVAGWLYAHHLKYLAPESLPSALSITAILMAVVGGSRYVLGPVVGTTVLVFVQNALPSEAAQGLLYGSALVVALLAAPDGLLGLARQAWTALRGRPRRRPPSPDQAGPPTPAQPVPEEVTR